MGGHGVLIENFIIFPAKIIANHPVKTKMDDSGKNYFYIWDNSLSQKIGYPPTYTILSE